jgi:hypothetical protein
MQNDDDTNCIVDYEDDSPTFINTFQRNITVSEAPVHLIQKATTIDVEFTSRLCPVLNHKQFIMLADILKFGDDTATGLAPSGVMRDNESVDRVLSNKQTTQLIMSNHMWSNICELVSTGPAAPSLQNDLYTIYSR